MKPPLLLACVLLAVASGAAAWRVALWDCLAGMGLPVYRCAWQPRARPGSFRHAQATLLRTPLDGGAYRQLGLFAEAEGKAAYAARLYRIAARRAPRDRVARYRLWEEAVAGNRMREAATHMDALLRLDAEHAPALLTNALPYLANHTFRKEWANQLTSDPDWRALLPAVLSQAKDAQSATALLEQIALSGPLRAEEAAIHAQLLERLGRALEARTRWRHALPVGLRRLDRVLFDGGFESSGGPAPYGWQFESPAGTAVGTDPLRAWEKRQSLAVVFDGRAVDFAGVSQDMVLAPGRYRLALHADVALRGSRPLAWEVRCRPSGVVLTRLELPASTGGWRAFAGSFIVPADCTMQRLQMVSYGRDLGERQVMGEMRFDAIEIVPLTDAGVRR